MAMGTDLTRIGMWHVGFVAAAALGALALDIGDPASVLFGGSVMAVNLWLMRTITDGLLRGASTTDGGRRVGLAVGAMVLKFGLFLGVVAALLSRLPIDGLSFAVGVTLLLAACVVGGVRGAGEPVKGEAASGTRL